MNYYPLHNVMKNLQKLYNVHGLTDVITDVFESQCEDRYIATAKEKEPFVKAVKKPS